MLSYERLIGRLGILDEVVDAVTQEDVLNRFWAIDNPNSRRATAIALRRVFGWKLRIPKGVPRRNETEETDPSTERDGFLIVERRLAEST